ncbi:MAG: M20/M25/M40 family metallo-hydrolase, partial [Rubrivivax sp.]
CSGRPSSATAASQRDCQDASLGAALAATVGCSVKLNPRRAQIASWQSRWEAAVAELGLPLHRLPSGAGHDAMKIHELLPQAMLFVRGGNGGISHNPLESVTVDDAELAVEAFERLLRML